jgi:FLVCR family MFS transporter 7
MDRQGLAYGVLLGGVMQAVGASLRYFACSFETAAETRITLLGQVLASLAMPFMVNSPAVFSANWFPTSMRATSTNVAVNANNMGVALVYLTAPFIVHSSDDIPAWNFYVAALAVASCTVGIFVFRSAPERETDEEDAAKPRLQDEYNWGQWSAAFSHTGFWHTLVAFSAAECVFNVVTAMLGKFLRGTNFSTAQIGLVGAAFIVSTLLGGQLVVHYVDKTRSHKTATQLCLVLTVVGLVAFRLVPKVDILATLASLLFLGAALGPLQPIVLELGVECAFPTSEATVAALQQLSGNFLSAIVVPGLSALQRTSFQGARETPLEVFYSSPEWILVLITALTFVVFCFLYVCDSRASALSRANLYFASTSNGTHKRYAQESRIILPHSCLEQEASCTGIANTP